MTAKPVTLEDYRASGRFVNRWAVTHINRDGMRTLTFGCQARCTFANQVDAEDAAKAIVTANGDVRLEECYGPQALGTFRASPVECWRMEDGRTGDPIGIYWENGQ